MKFTTLCYIEKDDKYLMLHRVKKERDENRDKWIGVGGKFEFGESPEECLLREVKEETGLSLLSYQFRGMITFVLNHETVEYMCLYTADKYEGELVECHEGILKWITKDQVNNLNLWEGDKIIFHLLAQKIPFFSLKLEYEGEKLISCCLNGKTKRKDSFCTDRENN